MLDDPDSDDVDDAAGGLMPEGFDAFSLTLENDFSLMIHS